MRRKVRIISLTAAGALLAVTVCAGVAFDEGAFKSRRAKPRTLTPADWAAGATGDTLVTDPTSQLTASQIAFLKQTADRTWAFLSGPDLDLRTHLPLDSLPLAG